MDPNKQKALDAALSQIERQFGKGTVMRMGDQERVAIPSISANVPCTAGPSSSPGMIRLIVPGRSSGKSDSAATKAEIDPFMSTAPRP